MHVSFLFEAHVYFNVVIITMCSTISCRKNLSTLYLRIPCDHSLYRVSCTIVRHFCHFVRDRCYLKRSTRKLGGVAFVRAAVWVSLKVHPTVWNSIRPECITIYMRLHCFWYIDRADVTVSSWLFISHMYVICTWLSWKGLLMSRSLTSHSPVLTLMK